MAGKMRVFLRIMMGGLILSLSALVQAQSAPALKSGEQVYRETCITCHGPGLAKAPRLGDKTAWGKLIAEGQPVLTAYGWVGVRGMPPKGGRADLSLEEFAHATAWMARAAGGDWKDPDAKMMARIRAVEKKRMDSLKKRGAQG